MDYLSFRLVKPSAVHRSPLRKRRQRPFAETVDSASLATPKTVGQPDALT
jgi:hypothetical protein